MKYWLVKTEPDECSIDTIAARGDAGMVWDGVRNYQARNFLREMQQGDQVLIYHSSCSKVGIVGLAEVTETAFVDPLQFDPDSPYFDAKSKPERPRWDAIRLQYRQTFARLLPLAELKKSPALAANPLVQKGSRLSVVPFTADEFQAVLALLN
ncbi:EVE domain-containing protein [Pseudidiomarina insulisalsae]|uniref:EVE domain-containing protein n=1 Tax=Pseudidiomarina insulisalsae TaxID=575789 RepID=A0A432YM92_9GAMM|nr:EVE domain-containing protein [Pseudidiomarina insulisalsae]RUO62084.1 EVE domain-containing protein [Pseudidiomarina insulisalsae]